SPVALGAEETTAPEIGDSSLAVHRLITSAVVRTYAQTYASDSSGFCDSAPTTPRASIDEAETIVAVDTIGERRHIDAEVPSTTAALASAGGEGATAVIPGLEIEEIDGDGQIILPGFVDGHMHSIAYANSIEELDLSQTRSLAEAVDAIRERALTMPVGEWVVGSGWDLNKWDDPRHPDRELLDQAVPDHPVAMWSLDLHTL